MGGNSATWGPGLAQLDSQGWVDTAEGYAKSGYNAAKDAATSAWNYFPQTEADAEQFDMLGDAFDAIGDLFAQADAEAEDVDAVIDSIGNLTLDDVYGAGVDAWNSFAQTDAERIHGHNRR